ncbi:MAG: hypothetical protein AAF322_00045 [Pseudomonadota bacterium]
MAGIKYAVELAFDDVDGLIGGAAIIGLGVETADGSIIVNLQAVPMTGKPLRLTKPPDPNDRMIAEAAADYRKGRR